MPIAATRSSADVRAKPFFQNTVMARRRATSLSNSLGRAIASTMAFLERIVKNIGHCNEGLAFNTRQGFFERPDLEAVVTALPAYLQDFTRFAYLTGWRKGEIISLRWTDVDRDAGAIRLRPEAAKTGRGRTVMLEGDLAELIDHRWESRLFEKDGNVRVTT